MKRYLAISVAVAALLTGCSAAAEQRWDLTLGLSYETNRNDDVTYNDVFVQGMYSYDNFGIQADVTSSEYSFLNQRDNGITLHAAYKLNPQWTLGAYYGHESFAGTDSTFGGIEAAYMDGPLKANGHIGKYDIGGAGEQTQFGVDFVYRLGGMDIGEDYPDPISGSSYPSSGPSSGPMSSFGGRIYVVGGWHGLSGFGDTDHMLYVGGATEIGRDLMLEAYLGRTDEDTTIGLGLSKEFGNGATFSRRGWNPSFKVAF